MVIDNNKSMVINYHRNALKPKNCITYHNHTVYNSLLASLVIGYAMRTKLQRIAQMITLFIQLGM